MAKRSVHYTRGPPEWIRTDSLFCWFIICVNRLRLTPSTRFPAQMVWWGQQTPHGSCSASERARMLTLSWPGVIWTGERCIFMRKTAFGCWMRKKPQKNSGWKLCRNTFGELRSTSSKPESGREQLPSCYLKLALTAFCPICLPEKSWNTLTRYLHQRVSTMKRIAHRRRACWSFPLLKMTLMTLMTLILT